MAVCEIIKGPANEVLRRKAEDILRIDGKVLAILEDMVETLKKAGGYGLAAPQIGISQRLVVARREENYIKLINPMILKAAGEQLSLEGCLSLPGIYGFVKRPERTVIQALDTSGKQLELTALRQLAATFAHEIDHLEGILLIDKAARLVYY